MKKLFIIFSLLLICFGCSDTKEEISFEVEEEVVNIEEIENEPIEDAPIEVVEEEMVTIETMMEKMTLNEKIGQLFIIRPDSLNVDLTAEEIQDSNLPGAKWLTSPMMNVYREYPAGGFALFAKNIIDETQLTNFASALHELDEYSLLCIDEEGGQITRIASHPAFEVEKFDQMQTIAERGNPEEAYYLGKKIGWYLNKYGLDLDFAPVADVNTNPRNTVIGLRAFGSDPTVAAEMVTNVINGLHDSETLSCIKHFPGHGDTSTDTHTGYAETLKTWEEMLSCEMIPFIAGINANTDMVMVAHIAAPNVTGTKEPATISYTLVTEKLREELGYNGVVITDSMAMGAITKHYSASEAAVKAILAGVDIILMPENYVEAFKGIQKALEDGVITIERIDESVRRILKLKGLK